MSETKDLEPIVNDDRLAFAQMAETIYSILSGKYLPVNVNDALAPLKKQCEDRVAAIDRALGV